VVSHPSRDEAARRMGTLDGGRAKVVNMGAPPARRIDIPGPQRRGTGGTLIQWENLLCALGPGAPHSVGELTLRPGTGGSPFSGRTYFAPWDRGHPIQWENLLCVLGPGAHADSNPVNRKYNC